MQKEIILSVEPRGDGDIGKNPSRRLRTKGLIPAVLYGKDKKSTPVSVNPKKLIEILTSETGENTIFSLQIQGKRTKDTVMIKDYQKDPVSDVITHADFVTIDLQKTIEVKVPIHIVGIPEGVKQQGGILDFIVREVDISCLPGDIPEHLEMDVSSLLIGQHLSISNLVIPEKVKILEDSEQTVVVVSAPRIEEVAVPAEAVEEAEEPEVVKKGKEEEAEGEEEEKKEQKEQKAEKGEHKEKKEK